MHAKTEYLFTINENKNKGKVSQNTTSLLDVNEMTCFGLLGLHQVAKFYETKYCCVWQMLRSHHPAKKIIYKIQIVCEQVQPYLLTHRLKHNLCFSLQHGHYSNPATPNLQRTTNREENDQCGNSTAQSQAPDDGYINVRNMSST